MDISYALALEDHARVNPLQGLDELMARIVPSEAKMQTIPKKAEVAAQNEQAVSELNAMLSGVSGAPKRIGRRAR